MTIGMADDIEQPYKIDNKFLSQLKSIMWHLSFERERRTCRHCSRRSCRRRLAGDRSGGIDHSSEHIHVDARLRRWTGAADVAVERERVLSLISGRARGPTTDPDYGPSVARPGC